MLIVRDGDLLAVAQAKFGSRELFGIQQRNHGEAGAVGVAILNPTQQRLRPVKAEHLPRARLRVRHVREAGDFTGRVVEEAEGLVILYPFEFSRGTTGCLILHGGDVLPCLLLLGLDDA
jgi:hypothetical protein